MRSDMTAQARIRDAAIEVFGAKGFEGASIRAIAEAAEVSPALVIHHYGSKDGLRQSCDDYLVEQGVALKADVDLDDQAQVSDLIRSYPPHHPWMVYISRIIQDGGTAGEQLWDRFQREAEEALDTQRHALRLRSEVDPVLAQAIATSVGLIPLIFQEHLARSLGVENLDGEAYESVMAALMTLLMSGLYEPEKGGPE